MKKIIFIRKDDLSNKDRFRKEIRRLKNVIAVSRTGAELFLKIRSKVNPTNCQEDLLKLRRVSTLWDFFMGTQDEIKLFPIFVAASLTSHDFSSSVPGAAVSCISSKKDLKGYEIFCMTIRNYAVSSLPCLYKRFLAFLCCSSVIAWRSGVVL